MRLWNRSEIIEFTIKIIIAAIAGVIIIFYNTQNVGIQKQPEDIYNEALEQYQQHYSQKFIPSDILSWVTIRNKIIINGERTSDEKEKLIYITTSTIESINTIITTKKDIRKTIKFITINKEKWVSRWYATHNTLTINYGNMTYQEFVQILTHELWHIIDLWIIEGNSSIKDKRFTEFEEAVFSEDDKSIGYYALSWNSENNRKKESKKIDFCSIYGMTNPFEDFAECIQIYLNHHAYFINIKESSNILEKKYEFIKRLFWNQYIYDNYTSNNKNNIEERYRDSTRME
jgi:hypothetical protein